MKSISLTVSSSKSRKLVTTVKNFFSRGNAVNYPNHALPPYFWRKYTAMSLLITILKQEGALL